MRAARPTPVGARYSPKASRSAAPHSPVVTPAFAAAIDAGMMLRPSRAAARKSFSAAGDGLGVARGAPGVEPFDLLGFDLMRHGEDRAFAGGERRGLGLGDSG